VLLTTVDDFVLRTSCKRISVKKNLEHHDHRGLELISLKPWLQLGRGECTTAVGFHWLHLAYFMVFHWHLTLPTCHIMIFCFWCPYKAEISCYRCCIGVRSLISTDPPGRILVSIIIYQPRDGGIDITTCVWTSYVGYHHAWWPRFPFTDKVSDTFASWKEMSVSLNAFLDWWRSIHTTYMAGILPHQGQKG
jgi:hypothetical protein